MHRHLTPRSLGRARWFADLQTALLEAEKLLTMLNSDGGFAGETKRLRLRIQTVQSELELLTRVMRGEGRVVSSNWPEPVAAKAAEA